MGLNINRKAKPPGMAGHFVGQESTTLGSACYEYRRLIGDDSRPALTTEVVEFADEHHDLDDKSVKRLFDHLWKQVESDSKSNLLLELSEVRSVDPLFRTELTYLSRQLHQQRRSVRMSSVSMEGDWESWL